MAGDGGDAATRAGHGGEAAATKVVATTATATTGPGARAAIGAEIDGEDGEVEGMGVAVVEVEGRRGGRGGGAHGDEAARGGSTSAFVRRLEPGGVLFDLPKFRRRNA